MSDNYRIETIQVAAVAHAMVVDRDHGSTAPTPNNDPVYGAWQMALDEIVRERARQEIKWGAQHHDPMVWMLILQEEVGEAAWEAVPIGEPYDSELGALIDRMVQLGKDCEAWLKANDPAEQDHG